MLFIILGIVAVVALGIFVAGFVSASPGEIKVISGPRGQRVIQGKTGWKMPILERVDKMTAGMISVDVRTADFVPTNDYINVKVDAAVKVKIGTEKPELFRSATRNFLYKSQSEIADEVRDTLEGHLRAIIGQMKLADIVTNRATFSEKVQDNATKDLEEMGLEIVAFNIQGLIDEKGVIENLGIDNTEQIRSNKQRQTSWQTMHKFKLNLKSLRNKPSWQNVKRFLKPKLIQKPLRLTQLTIFKSKSNVKTLNV